MNDTSSPSALSRPDPGYFALLVLLCIWGSGVMGLIAPLTGALGRAFSLQEGDVTLSYLTAVYIALYALGSVGWAALAERLTRHRILLVSSLLWSLSLVGVALAPDFITFAGAWCLTALCNAALLPVSFSMMIDVVAPHQRGRAFGWMATAQTMAMGQSFLLGGLLVERFGWRLPFLINAALGLWSVGLLLTFRRTEPRRGAMEQALQSLFASGHSYTPRFHLHDLKVLLKPRANLFLLLAILCATITLNAVAGWFIRMMEKDHDFTTSSATLFMMVLFLVQAPGAVLFGRLGDRLQKRFPNGKVRLLSVLVPALLPAYALGFNVPVKEWGTPGLILFGICVLTGATVASGIAPLTTNITGDINRPEVRGVMFSLLNIARMVGRGAGGILLTQLSSLLFEGRLGPAMATLSFFLVPCFLFLLPVFRRYAEDTARVSAELRAYAEGQQGEGRLR